MIKSFLKKIYIMGYNLKNARDGKSISKIPKWPSLGPCDYRVLFIRSSLNFREIKRICMENVTGEQGLALQQLFLYKSSYFLKNSGCHKILFLNDGGLKLGHFDIFDMLFPFLKFAKLWPIVL